MKYLFKISLLVIILFIVNVYFNANIKEDYGFLGKTTEIIYVNCFVYCFLECVEEDCHRFTFTLFFIVMLIFTFLGGFIKTLESDLSFNSFIKMTFLNISFTIVFSSIFLQLGQVGLFLYLLFGVLGVCKLLLIFADNELDGYSLFGITENYGNFLRKSDDRKKKFKIGKINIMRN